MFSANKKIYFLLFTLCFLLLSVFVFSSTARAVGYWGPLVPNNLCPIPPTVGGPTPTQACTPTVCNLFEVAQNGIKLLLSIILIALTPIFIIWGGILILTSGGSESRLRNGKDVLIGTVIGAAIALGSFLILNTFIWAIGARGALGSGSGNSSWSSIDCSKLEQLLPTPSTGGASAGSSNAGIPQSGNANNQPSVNNNAFNGGIDSLQSLGFSSSQLCDSISGEETAVSASAAQLAQNIGSIMQNYPTACISAAYDPTHSHHSSGSKHYSGCALDISLFDPNNPPKNAQQIVSNFSTAVANTMGVSASCSSNFNSCSSGCPIINEYSQYGGTGSCGSNDVHISVC